MIKTPLALAAALTTLLFGLAASDQVQADTRDQLIEFYQAMDGDNWINNDGWLDPEIHHCDWFGVYCHQASNDGPLPVQRLELGGNGLSGELITSGIFNITELRTLDLQDNHISGPLNGWSNTLTTLNLSYNQLEGELPDPGMPGSSPPESTTALWQLNLSGNQFTGPVPASWEDLELSELNLANNRLDGSVGPAFAALRQNQPAIILTNNRFTGPVPEWVMELSMTGSLRYGGNINLCWNDIEIDSDTLADWIGQHHVGGENFTDCLDRERFRIDASVSGSWFSPARAGQGLSLMQLDNGRPLVYWFTHRYNDQWWLFSVGHAGENHLVFPDLLRTHGRFGDGGNRIGGSDTDVLRLDRMGPQNFHAEYTFLTYPNYDILGLLFPPRTWRTEHVQLTRLAGTRCDNQQDHQWVSGAWFDPSKSGEGFVVEVIEDGRGVVYWFTYSPDGKQAWMMGDGDFTGTTLHIEDLYQPLSSNDTLPGETSGVDMVRWGSLTLDFDDELSGKATFASDVEGYGSDSYLIERLARPMLAECED